MRLPFLNIQPLETDLCAPEELDKYLHCNGTNKYVNVHQQSFRLFPLPSSFVVVMFYRVTTYTDLSNSGPMALGKLQYWILHTRKLQSYLLC